MMRRFTGIALVALVTLGVAGQSWAAEILNFKPTPISPTLDEFVWTGTNLTTGPGANSNGDGNDLGQTSASQQPGLTLSTPFEINGVSSSETDPSGTTFYDASMRIRGFFASSPAQNIGGVLIQPLSNGDFAFRSSTDTTGGSQLLLLGRVDDATITGLNNSTTGSVLSGSVTYTGGLIYNQMLAEGFPVNVRGALSWSLTDIQQPLSINGQNGFLSPFGADGAGSFDAIPAPAALPAGLALLGSFAAFRRRRAA